MKISSDKDSRLKKKYLPHKKKRLNKLKDTTIGKQRKKKTREREREREKKINGNDNRR